MKFVLCCLLLPSRSKIIRKVNKVTYLKRDWKARFFTTRIQFLYAISYGRVSHMFVWKSQLWIRHGMSIELFSYKLQPWKIGLLLMGLSWILGFVPVFIRVPIIFQFGTFRKIRCKFSDLKIFCLQYSLILSASYGEHSLLLKLKIRTHSSKKTKKLLPINYVLRFNSSTNWFRYTLKYTLRVWFCIYHHNWPPTIRIPLIFTSSPPLSIYMSRRE